MSRDWQKDMEMMKGTFEFDWTNYQDLQIAMGEALPYWLQQYAEAMKLLNDTAERSENGIRLLEQANSLWAAEKERADKAEAREQKLREVIEEAMEEEWRLAGEQTPVYIILCQSLDPKEETKPAVLEEEEA